MGSPLPSGTRLDRFQIISQLGAGGMGEVYLAEDTRLHRKVALKILPVELASHHDRMRRFIQEATAAASLNHPNIAHIYETGEAEAMPPARSVDGRDRAGRETEVGEGPVRTGREVLHFIAMEFIDGITLREKRLIDASQRRGLGGGAWAPDGRAIIYSASQNGVSNLWSLPLNGGKPSQNY